MSLRSLCRSVFLAVIGADSTWREALHIANEECPFFAG
jgi:hypothetical protein